MTDQSNAQAIIDVTQAGADPFLIAPDEVYAFRAASGTVHVVDGRLYQFRAKGNRTVFDAASFVAYIDTQREDGAKVWVDETTFAATAVLNDHGPDLPGWGDHRITLNVRRTDSWQAWAKFDGQLASQTQLAEHIEDNAPDVVQPAAAEMLEIAQSFQANTKVTFESSKFLAGGQRALEYREDTEARAGHKGSLEIPAEFALGLQPFIGSEVYRVTARFRYRIGEGQLRIGYKLNRPADVLRAAFGDVVRVIRAGLDELNVPILNGTP